MLGKAEILKLFEELERELAVAGEIGEIYLVGGAVMTLVFDARASTRDVDAYFKPATSVREAAARIAARHSLDASWLNDAVKGYLSPSGNYAAYWDRPHLKVFTAAPEYLLAMKCLAMRLGPEFHDESDVRFLLRYLNIATYAGALAVIERYYPRERFPQKTLYVLEDLLS